MKKRMKGFTLIELIAVLVIMAIIALIVTPLVMSIIRKARVAADKRSIDAYGRSIELAIAGYLLDNGKFPTEVSQLTIEYSGNEVVCSTTQINADSSVYLAGCTVAGRSVEDYIYGKYETPTYTAYQIGDHVQYNGVTYYVIEDSDTASDTVKLLKEELLTKTEMDNLNLIDVSITKHHLNNYGKVQYGSTTDYSTSTVKQVVDAWKNSAVTSGDTATARLITYDELINNLGYERNDVKSYKSSSGSTPSWIYSNEISWWTMSQYGSDISKMWVIYDDGALSDGYGDISAWRTVRPVLELNKSASITKLAS